jgi:hypothetical protein
MFGAVQALKKYIDALPPSPFWLVINGFVGFVAKRPNKHFDPSGGLGKLERIAPDASFQPIFEGTRRFLVTPGHRLAVVLGHNDVELALPWVQTRLTAILTDGDEAAAARITYSLRGEGLLRRLDGPPGPRLLCVHRDEVHAWNVVNHERVRRIAQATEPGVQDLAERGAPRSSNS